MCLSLRVCLGLSFYRIVKLIELYGCSHTVIVPLLMFSLGVVFRILSSLYTVVEYIILCYCSNKWIGCRGLGSELIFCITYEGTAIEF